MSDADNDTGTLSFCIWEHPGTGKHRWPGTGQVLSVQIRFGSCIGHALNYFNRVVPMFEIVVTIEDRELVHGSWLGCPTNGTVIMPKYTPPWISVAIRERGRENPSQYLDENMVLREARITGYEVAFFHEADDSEVRARILDPEMAHLPEQVPCYSLDCSFGGMPTQETADACVAEMLAVSIAAHKTGACVSTELEEVFRKYAPQKPDIADEEVQ